jgi:predicted AAA+ superfamily ATPase
MRFLPRELESQVAKVARQFPAMVLTGPRRAGKTSLLKRMFPKASYFLLEDPDLVARLRADPHEFFDAVETPVILDEIQNVPEVLAFVRSRIDRQPRRKGQWFLTSLQETPLMHGVSESTIAQWLSILEMTAQVLIIPPYLENLGKRLIKSPKVYLADSGLVCPLRGIETAAELAKSPFRGALFEGFVAAEFIKSQTNSGRRRELYYFRDKQGLEVDFLMPSRSGSILLVECKAGQTVTPYDALPMQRLNETLRKKRPRGTRIEMHLVHRPSTSATVTPAISPGVRAWAFSDFVTQLGDS